MLIELAGKRASVVSIAKDQSIAWGVAPHRNGGRLAITYLNDKAEHYVRPLAEIVGAEITLPLDVTRVGQEKPLFTRIAGLWGGHDMVVRSIAFAPGDDLHGSIVDFGPTRFRDRDGCPGSLVQPAGADLLRSLVREIPLTPAEGTFQIDIRGDPAGILAVWRNDKRPATRAGRSQVEMVAGAGFEPATFRL